MRGRPPTRPARTSPARLVLAGLALAVALPLPAGAHADDAASLRAEADRLRAESGELAVVSRSSTHTLYALATRLVQAERDVDALRARAVTLERRRAAARARLRVAQSTLAEAERRLASRLRRLYLEGEPDPLSILLETSSLDEAIVALDGFRRLAREDRRIVEQVEQGRAELHSALRALAESERELEGVIARAEAARIALVRARNRQAARVADLSREQRLNELEIARLSEEAATAEAEERAPSATAPTSTPTPTSPPATGKTITVLATGYSLSGTTATGTATGWGIVAVDPAVIPLGTRMTIPGYGEGVAADIGSGVRGAMIDLWFPTHAAAIAWGQRTVTITLH